MHDTDRSELERLQRRYGDTVSCRAWGELPGLFAPDCTLSLALARGDEQVEGADAIVEFVSRAVDAFDTFVFEVMNAVVDDDGTGRMWIHELRWRDGDHTHAHGLYEDTFTRGPDGLWRFATRRYASISGGRFHP